MRKTTNTPPGADNLFGLLPYQHRYVGSAAKRLVWEKSRRIGGSKAAAVRFALMALTEPPGTSFYWLSRTALHAQDIIRKEVVPVCRGINAYFQSAHGYSPYDLDNSSKSIIRLKSGSEIVGLSSDPEAATGYTGHVLVDEAAKNDQQEELFNSVSPIADGGPYTLHYVSSHKGLGFFYRLCQRAKKKDDPWTLMSTSVYDACDEGLIDNLIHARGRTDLIRPTPRESRLAFIEECRKANPRGFPEEFELKAGTGGDNLIWPDQYMACEQVPLRCIPDPQDCKGTLYGGLDVGRSRDLTCLWLLRLDYRERRPFLHSVSVTTWHNTSLPEQQRQIIELLHPVRKKIAQLTVDRIGIGAGLYDGLLGTLPNVVGHFTTPSSKQEMCELVRKVIVGKQISLPQDDAIREDICSMQTTVTPSGNLKYSGTTEDSHCDRFSGLALGVLGAKELL